MTKSVIVARFPIKADFSVTFEAAKEKGLIWSYGWGDHDLQPEDFRHDHTRGIQETEVCLLSTRYDVWSGKGWSQRCSTGYVDWREAFTAHGLRSLELPHLVALAEQYTYDAFANLSNNGVISYTRRLAAVGMNTEHNTTPYVWGEKSLHICADYVGNVECGSCFFAGVPK